MPLSPAAERSANMDILQKAPLGKKSAMPTGYDPQLLFPIPRTLAREPLGLAASQPFFGADVWTAFEMGWRNQKGKPQVGIATFSVPCTTPHMIESKSFKLYLNSLNDEKFDSKEALLQRLRMDLEPVLWGEQPVGAPLGIELVALSTLGGTPIGELAGQSLDEADIDWEASAFAIEQMRVQREGPLVEETLRSDLIRALCRVTAQPDWGSVEIRYRGHAIEHEDLLRYLLSFRHQQEFHEPLAERIFIDLWRHAKPSNLSVYIRFVRRGGLDINPFRSSDPTASPTGMRLARQ